MSAESDFPRSSPGNSGQTASLSADVAALSRLRDFYWVAGGSFASTLIAFLAVNGSSAIAFIALTAIVLYLRLSDLFAYSALALAATALPAATPTAFYFAGIQIFSFEPPLIVAAAVALYRLSPRLRMSTLPLVGFIGLGVTVGILSGHSRDGLNIDARSTVDMLMAFLVAMELMARGKGLQAWKVLVITQVLSAAMTVLASATGLSLNGREGNASISVGQAASEATRFLSPAVYPATAILCALLASVLLGIKVPWRKMASVSAFLLLFLAFSRNTILAIAVSCACVGVLMLLHGRFFALVSNFAKVSFAFIIAATLFALVAPHTPIASWYQTQVSGYAARVFTGLTGATLSVDPSVAYREIEKPYLWRSIATSPIWGHGFGYPYKPPLGEPGSFFATTGRFYAHQYYLWVISKTGLVGFALIMFALLRPVVIAIRGNAPIGWLTAPALAALLAVSFVAPMPNGLPNALVVGACLGVLAISRDKSTGANGPSVVNGQGPNFSNSTRGVLSS